MNRNRPSEHRLSDNRSFRRPWYMMMFPRILSAAAQRRLQAHLKKGGLVAYPTESCYGLGCVPTLPKALNQLIHLKKRPQHKGMIVIGHSLEQLQPLLQRPSENIQTMLHEAWPASKTFLLPAAKKYCLHCGEKDAVNWLSEFLRTQVQGVCVRFWKCL